MLPSQFLRRSSIVLFVTVLCTQNALAIALRPIERDESGKVFHMSHKDAELYCIEHGSRLPTIRELAEETTKWGAKMSVVELDGYDAVYKYNGSVDYSGKGPVDFFHSASDYRRPTGDFADFGNFRTWSSSSFFRFNGQRYFYVLHGDDGTIWHEIDRDINFSVRCAQVP
jgi:hypothetical protein